MKTFYNGLYKSIGILLLVVLCIPFMAQCNNSAPVEKIVYVPTPDSIAINELILLKEELRKTKDSLRIINNDTINGELFVAKYKLERIRYYRDICVKRPTNKKFFMGWVNRVLDER